MSKTADIAELQFHILPLLSHFLLARIAYPPYVGIRLGPSKTPLENSSRPVPAGTTPSAQETHEASRSRGALRNGQRISQNRMLCRHQKYVLSIKTTLMKSNESPQPHLSRLNCFRNIMRMTRNSTSSRILENGFSAYFDASAAETRSTNSCTLPVSRSLSLRWRETLFKISEKEKNT